MKKTQMVLSQIRNVAGIMLVVAAVAFTQGCASDNKNESRTEDALENTGDAIEADANEVGNDFERERREAVAEMNQEKDELDARIDRMQADIKREGAEAKAETKQELAELEQERKELGNDIDKAQNATAEAWQEIKGGFKRAGKNIGNAAERAGEKLDGDNN